MVILLQQLDQLRHCESQSIFYFPQEYMHFMVHPILSNHDTVSGKKIFYFHVWKRAGIFHEIRKSFYMNLSTPTLLEINPLPVFGILVDHYLGISSN